MNIVIIGSGNVAYHLAKAFTEKGISIAQLFGRNSEDLQSISEELKIPYSPEKIAIADLYIICVKDDAIAEISAQIPTENCLVAHTSGAVSIKSLVGKYRKAVLYPLQSFSKTKNLVYSEIPFFLDAETEEDKTELQNLVKIISDNIEFADDQKRKYIHLTAVFACNFTNHLYARAKEISDSQNIPFHYFFPLIDETTNKIHTLSPQKAQTGPAIRNDVEVLASHRNLLQNDEQLKIFDTLNESIKKMYDL